jgi:hypothetical protein
MSRGRRSGRAPVRPVLTWLAVLLAAPVALTFGGSPALAADWMQVSCVNPDGSAAPSDGWSSFTAGSPEFGSDNNTQCGAGSPMSASLSDAGPAPVGAYEGLQYQPPSGSRLVGGSLNVSLVANGTGSAGGGFVAKGSAALYQPAFRQDESNVFFRCVQGGLTCPNGGADYAGDVSLPPGRGGSLYAAAGCDGLSGNSCNSGGTFSAWALVQVHRADLLLNSVASPTGAGFSGSALQPRARGTAHLVFTAADPGGPGVYQVTAAIDGRNVFSATPNTNGGQCVPVGTDPASGALMFDWQQPCPPTEGVDLPVPTAGLTDGGHELAVTVTDAAQSSSTVLDQTISTSNPQTTPVPRSRRAVHARFVISWSWNGPRTLLRSIKVQKLTRSARVAVRCLGRGCPRLKVRSASSRHVRKLLRGLGNKRFRAGNRLRITVTAPHRTAERIELDMRNNRQPRARLVKR